MLFLGRLIGNIYIMIYTPLEQFELGLFKLIFLSSDYDAYFLDLSWNNLSLFFLVFLFFYYNLFLLQHKNGIWSKILSYPVQGFSISILFFILITLRDNLQLIDLKYYNLTLSLFFLVLFSNVIGIAPYTYAVTGHLIVTFSLAFCIFFGVNIIGALVNGMYMLSLLLPGGISFIIAPLLIIIEFISYNFRVVSLSVRLFANIMAGHTLMVVVHGFNFFLITKFSTTSGIFLLPILLAPTILLIVALVVLELGVALIQAYVFMLLTVMYLYDAKYLH